jgi:hypothetical protein
MTEPNPPWSRLYEDIKIQIPGVIDAVQAQATFSLFKDFCDKTNIWQEEVPIHVLPDEVIYPFDLAGIGAPNRLLVVYDPAQAFPDKRWVQGNIQMSVPGVITISYPPSTAASWRAIVTKTPTEPTTGDRYPQVDPPDYWIIDKYREALMYGVMARLQGMPGKPYSNDKQAGRNNQYYLSERNKARVDVLHANTYGGQRWVYPQGWATVRRGGWA